MDHKLTNDNLFKLAILVRWEEGSKPVLKEIEHYCEFNCNLLEKLSVFLNSHPITSEQAEQFIRELEKDEIIEKIMPSSFKIHIDDMSICYTNDDQSVTKISFSCC